MRSLKDLSPVTSFSDLRFLGPEYYSRYKVNRRPIFFNYSGYKPFRSWTSSSTKTSSPGEGHVVRKEFVLH